MRTAKITRNTNETQITVELNIDGTGTYANQTGVGFFDHMLDQLAKHALFDLKVTATGDLHIDDHHTVEDVGIALGEAFLSALDDKRGIERYGNFILPMDEARIECALDLSGRPYFVWDVDFNNPKIGTFDTELVEEFFNAFATNARMTLHIVQQAGQNNHHVAEASFKAVARALKQAVRINTAIADQLPTTKGKL